MSAREFVRHAMTQVGLPYETHRDCSGFTAWAARQVGLHIPEGSVAQYSVGTPIALTEVKAGDLVFWDTFGPAPGHVAIAVNPREVVHALNEDAGILVSPITANMGGPIMGARRIFLSGDPPNPKHRKGQRHRRRRRLREVQTTW